MHELTLTIEESRLAAERDRLRELQRFHLLDTPPEEAFDDLVRLAARLCEVPMATITLIDEHRQWFKARVGVDVCETPRDISMCAHVIHGSGLLEVSDATRDARFCDNPLVRDAPHVRHFAGVPLTTASGYNIGSLSVFDVRPRVLDALQREALALLGRQVARLFDARAAGHGLAERLATHQLLLDAVGDAVISTDAEGRITGLNVAAEELCRYPQAELLGMPLASIFPALAPGAALSGTAQPSLCLRRDGSRASAMVQAYPLHEAGDGAPRGMAVLAKRASQAAAFQQRLQNIASQLPCMVFQIVRGNGGLLALPYVSDVIVDIFGCSAAAAQANPGLLRAAIHPDDLPAVVASVEQATADMRQWSAELRVCHPDKGVLWVEGRAMPQAGQDGTTVWYGVFNDITERKRQQLALDTQLQTNLRLLESLAEGVVICDEHGKLILFNDTARNWFGDGSKDVPLAQWADHFVLYRPGGAALPVEEWPLRQALAGTPVREMEFSISAGGRPERFLAANAQPLRAPDGRLLGAVVVMHDITERKHIELRQREFVSTVSHELRTPLTSISGSLGLLCGGALGEVPPAMRAMLDIAHQNSLRLSHLINDLLDMDKLVAGKMHFDLGLHTLDELLHESLRANQAYAQQHGVTLALDPVPAASVRTDAMRLQQVLANFLSNAIKFSPSGAQVRIGCTLRGARVRIAVSDRGPGIPANFHSRIFQKFSQVDSSDSRQKGGTGLGLAISKELIERMGGQIGFESTEGEGACFWCELPLSESAAASLEHDPAGALPILVVEDEPDIARLLRTLLEQAGYDVVEAAGLTQARTCLAQRAFAAVTVDLALTDGNGADLVRELRDTPATRQIPILVVSAFNQEGRLMLNGCFEALDWFDKPIDPDMLVAAVHRMVRGSAPRPRILHIEDDADLSKVIGQQVRQLADVVPASSLAQARELLAGGHFDLILLDLALPDGSGLELLEELQRVKRTVPVVVMSAQELPPGQLPAVHGVLAKTRSNPQQLLQMLHDVLQEQKEENHA